MSLFPVFSPTTGPGLEFLQAALDSTDSLSTYTFTSQNFGAAHPSRELICVACGQSDNTSVRIITSATIGGVSTTTHVQAGDPVGNDLICGIVSASVPTGTSGTVSVTFSDGMLFCAIGLYRAIKLASTTPFDTGTGSPDPVVMSCDIPDNGILVGGAVFDSSGALTISGVSEDYNAVVDGTRVGMGSASRLAAETSRTVTFNGGTGAAAGVCASWQ